MSIIVRNTLDKDGGFVFKIFSAEAACCVTLPAVDVKDLLVDIYKLAPELFSDFIQSTETTHD